ncbi:PREDICTED: LOW QUALITY PROTEIN: olfactory receptor 51F2-like [Ceratotherium simum simum]|uniref:LOW QUALITY PROTEIN: olfactory receptor 51F2-like n=1 Tax=Ceratotherium simum simum TaxID=73337 RepID=A0ABM1D1L8_CERSS|nr:PREDICTED: LOW QUALITY PROTEIN: olfactory receptor 51F2-like [Ceratotherium simum simum]
MSSFPNITSSSLKFFLMGVPGLEASHAWISIPFCCLYITAPSGGGIILFVIIIESSLHKSMHYFLSMLSTADLDLCISTLVTMLGIFWFTARQIIFHACVAQTFFIQLFTVMESSVLLVMAFDHFIAICNPLRYTTILTDSRILNMWFAILVRSTVILMPLVLLLRHLCSCQSHVLHHSYCFHPDIIQLSCSDNKINSVLGLTALIVTAEVDSIFIPLSNTLIIKTILSIASPQEQHKAFSICVAHIGAVVIFYIPLISLCFVHRFGQKVPPYVHSLMANVYLLILPVMNPIIYSGKTKQIQRSIKKVLFPKGSEV